MNTLFLTLGLILAAETTGMNTTESPSTGETRAAERSERIRSAYNEVRADNLYLLDDLYAPDLVFEDPLDRTEGLDEFKIYMEAMYQYVEDIHWEYHDEVIQGDTHVLVWTMTLQTASLNKGEPFTIDGVSHLRFGEDNKIVYHRDYFDMGEYIYERVPVVKWFVNKVKKRLHKAVDEARDKAREAPGAP